MTINGYQFLKDTKQDLQKAQEMRIQQSQLDAFSKAIEVQQKNSELYEKMIAVLENQVKEIEGQNELLRQQLDDANASFGRSMKFNIAMLIVSIISTIGAVVSVFI